MPYTKEALQSMETDTILLLCNAFAGTLNSVEGVRPDILQEIQANVGMLDCEIHDRLQARFDAMTTQVNERYHNHLIWKTQGGGLARKVGEEYIFVKKPDCPGFDVGDLVPREWKMTPY